MLCTRLGILLDFQTLNRVWLLNLLRTLYEIEHSKLLSPSQPLFLIVHVERQKEEFHDKNNTSKQQQKQNLLLVFISL